MELHVVQLLQSLSHPRYSESFLWRQ